MDEENEQAEAAKKIQKAFRQSRKAQGAAGQQPELNGDRVAATGDFGTADEELKDTDQGSVQQISSNERWDDALLRNRLEHAASASASGANNDAKSRWHRGVMFAGQISGPGADSTSEDTSGKTDTLERAPTTSLRDKIKEAKSKAYNRDPVTGKCRTFNGKKDGQKAIKIKKGLEEQHWLEMIDKKHRYGSNLKYYFEEWQVSEEAKGNFFYWLDVGAGAQLSLPECSREKLEKERILYLSLEQRRHYRVMIDKQTGQFRWKHPAALAVEASDDEHPVVDTTGRKWTDLGGGEGMAPASVVPPSRVNIVMEHSVESSSDSESDASDSSSESSSSGESAADQPSGDLKPTSATALPQEPKPDEKKEKKDKGDVWIYCSDADYNLYCGIKQKGSFQHSSFLAGGPITSAGTLVVQDGIPIKFSPMSGHYRTKSLFFKRFIEEMERQGADLSQVRVGKTELKLWFVERANTWHTLKGKTRRLKKGVGKKLDIGA